jgi:hypothetical protein
VDDVELAELIRERQKQISERAPLAGGETGAGPVIGMKTTTPRTAVHGRSSILRMEESRRRRPKPLGARRLAAARGARGPADAPEDRSLYDRCITRGLPGSMMPAIYGNSYQIVQAPGYVAIRYEMVHETRLIPLDGRPHAGSNIRFYMGDARGHFEGKTLVVETTNFTDRTNYRGASKQLRMVERFTPVTPTLVEWSVTFDDDHTCARPWTFAMNLTKDDVQQVFEYACHEGNYELRNILSADVRKRSRRTERTGRPSAFAGPSNGPKHSFPDFV